MDPTTFHTPTELERAFLRVVTHGYPALERQIEACEISEYEVVGYYDVRVIRSDQMQAVWRRPIDGPFLALTDPDAPRPQMVEISDSSVHMTVHMKLQPGEPPQREQTTYAPKYPKLYAVDVLLWTDERGLLSSVEICSYGDGYIENPCAIFVEEYRAKSTRLQFRAPTEPLPET